MPETIAIQGSDEILELQFKDNTNLWDQLRQILSDLRWVANDIASMSLMQELDNVHPIFLVRKSDGKLVGSLISIEMEHHTFGGMYYTHPDYRADGIGKKISGTYIKRHAKLLATKPFIYRSVPIMTSKYSNEYKGYDFYTVFSIEFDSSHDVLSFFPVSSEPSGHIVPIRDLSPRQFRQFCDYDHYVTGSDRTKFLQDYYSISLVNGVVLFDNLGKITGCAAISPTTYEPGIYKIGPVYASRQEDAHHLIRLVVSLKKEPHAKFVFLCRQKSAGDAILQKCKEQKVKMHEAGDLGCTGVFGPVYVDRSRPEHIFIGQASPCFFDI